MKKALLVFLFLLAGPFSIAYASDLSIGIVAGQLSIDHGSVPSPQLYRDVRLTGSYALYSYWTIANHGVDQIVTAVIPPDGTYIYRECTSDPGGGQPEPYPSPNCFQRGTFVVYGGAISSAVTTNLLTPDIYSSGVATTSVAQYCNGTLSTSTNIITQTASDFSYGICVSFALLFVPNADVLAQYGNLASTTKSKFPVLTQVQTEIATLTASSTANLPHLSLNMHDLGIGSTTAIGNILPNFDALSSTTVQSYMPAGTLDALKALAVAAIWLTFIADVFFTVRALFHTS